jgi:hypothetical protein
MMRIIVQKLFIVSALAVLLIACGGANIGNSGNAPSKPNTPNLNPTPMIIKVDYVDVNKIFPQLSYPPNYVPTRGSAVYVSPVGRVGVTPLYLLNGYNSPVGISHNVQTHQYWVATTPIQIVPQEFTYNYQNNSITFLDHDSQQNNGMAWRADNFEYRDNGILGVDWSWANGFTNISKRKTPFYSVGDYAVIGYDKELAFLKFVPGFAPNDLPSYITDFSQACALNSSDAISSINTITKLGNIENNDYIIIGTTSGGICTFGMANAKTRGWTNLTKFAVDNAYKTNSKVAAIQFVTVANDNYIYWITTGGVSRIKVDTIGNPHTFENLSNNMKYKDVPHSHLLNPAKFLVDFKGNIYIGGLGSVASPTKVYVLPAGTSLWQAVTLSEIDTNNVNSIMLCLDGVTPVVGTGKVSDNIYDQNTRAYYIKIQQK